MCGIVGAVAQRDVAEILINGLHRLEYRGYDSAGLAVVDAQHELQRVRCLGKVHTPVGQLTVHLPKITRIRMFPAISQWCITALLKIMKNYVPC